MNKKWDKTGKSIDRLIRSIIFYRLTFVLAFEDAMPNSTGRCSSEKVCPAADKSHGSAKISRSSLTWHFRQNLRTVDFSPKANSGSSEDEDQSDYDEKLKGFFIRGEETEEAKVNRMVGY